MIADARCLCDGHLAVRMKELIATSRTHENWGIVFSAEQFDAHVDLRNIVEPARAQLQLQESLAIGSQGALVVDSRGHVAEMRWWHILARDGLEVEDVNRVLWAFNQLPVG